MKKIFIILLTTIFMYSCSDNSSKGPIDIYDANDMMGDIVNFDIHTDTHQDLLSDTLTDVINTDILEEDIQNSGDAITDIQENPDVEYICKSIVPDAGINNIFIEKSEEMNLKEKVIGIRLMSADLNNDYFPDLIVHRVNSNTRDDFSRIHLFTRKGFY